MGRRGVVLCSQNDISKGPTIETAASTELQRFENRWYSECQVRDKKEELESVRDTVPQDRVGCGVVWGARGKHGEVLKGF